MAEPKLGKQPEPIPNVFRMGTISKTLKRSLSYEKLESYVKGIVKHFQMT